MNSEGAGQLGRGVVAPRGHEPPEAWASCPRVLIGDASLSDPGPAAEDLHRYWIDRRAVVVVLDLDPTALRAPERCDRPVYELRPDFEFSRERLQFLVWANNYDARGGEPVWWHGRKAARQFAHDGVVEGGPADVTLADGSPLFIDGGRPIRLHSHQPSPQPTAQPTLQPSASSTDGTPKRDGSNRPGTRLRHRSWRRTSWPQSVTAPGQPGSSHRRARARPGSSPSDSVT